MLIKNGFLFFWHEWPSNWTASPMAIDGVRYGCVEQWMMAAKARMFHDDATLAKILAAPDAKAQKALGRQVRSYDESVWARERYDVVKRGVLEKYRQNPELRSKLLATEDLELAEASPFDRIWGIGLAENDPRAWNRETWFGQNLLGRMTGEVRTIIRAGANDVLGRLF